MHLPLADVPRVLTREHHDGIIDLTVGINPNVSLSSDAGIDFGVGATVALFRDLPFGLDPIMLFNDQVPLLDFSFFNETFALQGFNQESWNLVA